VKLKKNIKSGGLQSHMGMTTDL